MIFLYSDTSGQESTAEMPDAKAAGGILATITEVIKGILTLMHSI